MRPLMLLLLIVASVAVLAGVLAKIQHWPLANVLLGGGLATEMLCGVILLIHSLKRRNAGR